MRSDTKNCHAFGITAVDYGVMTQNEFPEPRRTVLDRASNVRELADASVRGFEDPLVHVALPGAPLLLRVGENLARVAVGPWRNDNLNT